MWPVCIPEKAESNQDKYKGTDMVLLGFGPADKGEILTQEILTIRKSSYCNRRYTVKPFDLFSENIETSLPELFNDDSSEGLFNNGLLFVSQCAPGFLTPTKNSMDFFNFIRQLYTIHFRIS